MGKNIASLFWRECRMGKISQVCFGGSVEGVKITHVCFGGSVE